MGNDEPALHLAARVGDHDAVRALVAAGADANERFDIRTDPGARPRLVTPLMLAAGSQDGATADTVRLLIELSVVESKELSAALAYACRGFDWRKPRSDSERVAVLLDAGADPDSVTDNGFPALACAAQAGDADTIELLLTAGADPADAGPTTEFPRAPLHCAAEAGSLDCVRLLLAAGAPTDVQGPRHPIAASAASAEVLAELLAAGADPTAECEFSQTIAGVIARNEEVSVSERTAMLRLLVEHGVDIDSGPLVRPLWAAAQRADADAVEALLAAGADPLAEPNALGGAGWGTSTRDGDTDRTIDRLIAAGCDVHHRDAKGLQPLHGALMWYSHGAGYESSDGSNAVAAAALIRHGASIDITFSNGFRPLHMVATDGNAAAIELLLAAGADVRELTPEGESALDLARNLLECAQAPPDRDVLRSIYKSDDDAAIDKRVSEQLHYRDTYRIPQAQRCVDLLKNAGAPEKTARND